MPPPHFDPQFALTGGEDKDFFLRLKALGARFAWAAEAVSYTAVPATRGRSQMGIGARLWRRQFGHAHLPQASHRPGHDGAGTGKIAAALLLSPLLALIMAASPHRRMEALRKLFRAAGKTAALFGSHYQEYSVIHGE